jgi:ATP-dependent DNA helicase RecG
LAVVDEQQRFGVEQRRGLTTKAQAPDLLVMTATPIPRSLALTLYGDLDLSIIDQLPPGRQPVRTSLLPKERRPDLYRALERRLHDGGQAFIVVPFIEASEAVDGASLEVEGAEIEGWLGAHACARLHGRLTREERESIMARFLSGELRVLLATTVIEVGVDVPQASTMIIESAERFGLAQLHQLRGRVGRGREAAHCVALHGRLTDEAKSRLDALAATCDGFEIAERDLEIRGPGDLLGKRQSGMPVLQMANLRRDVLWLDRACRDARDILAQDPESVR